MLSPEDYFSRVYFDPVALRDKVAERRRNYLYYLNVVLYDSVLKRALCLCRQDDLIKAAKGTTLLSQDAWMRKPLAYGPKTRRLLGLPHNSYDLWGVSDEFEYKDSYESGSDWYRFGFLVPGENIVGSSYPSPELVMLKTFFGDTGAQIAHRVLHVYEKGIPETLLRIRPYCTEEQWTSICPSQVEEVDFSRIYPGVLCIVRKVEGRDAANYRVFEVARYISPH